MRRENSGNNQRGASGTLTAPSVRLQAPPTGAGTPEHRENHRLLLESQRPAGVGAVMGKPPGTGPSGPGRITEQKEKR